MGCLNSKQLDAPCAFELSGQNQLISKIQTHFSEIGMASKTREEQSYMEFKQKLHGAICQPFDANHTVFVYQKSKTANRFTSVKFHQHIKITGLKIL